MESTRQGSDDFASAKDRGKLPFGFYAYLGAGVSILFCYAQVLADLILPLFSVTAFQINSHVQAVLMWSFALVAVIGLYRDQRAHHGRIPLLLGLSAVLIIVGTLYAYYDILILILGYLFLVAAVLLNPAMLLMNLNRSVRRQARELAELNSTLEDRVQAQVEQIDRLARLKRFLPPEVVGLITEKGEESLLDSHRRLIACLFCDVRNFTAFSDAVEPEEVMDVLQKVHRHMGQLVAEHGGTIGYRSGDGLMVIFNDPLPCDEPVRRAVELALEMKTAFGGVQAHWRNLGHEIGFGIGVSYGYATLGLIGSEGRYDYTAIGNVVNIAARLCDRADDGEVLIDKRSCVEIEGRAKIEPTGPLDLKGIGKPVEAYKVTGSDLGGVTA